jgi:hypothetical protein
MMTSRSRDESRSWKTAARCVIWGVGLILVATSFEPGTLPFYVSAGLVLVVGSTTSPERASDADDVRAAKE